MRMFGRLLIAVALVAGSGEEVLPGIADDAPQTSSCPIGPSDGENDPGEELALLSPLDVDALIPLESRLLPDDSLVVHSSLVVRRIPHVPIPALHV